MMMPGRKFSAGNGYRYGFNGYENDNDIKGIGNSIDFGSRIYDPRINRWLSLDPLQKKYPGESHYVFVSSNPILYKDINGKDKIITVTILNKDGSTTQIQKIDKGYFKYSWSLREDGFYFRKSDVKQSLTIDLRAAEENILESNFKGVIQFSSDDDVNTKYISAGSFLDGKVRGDNSDEVAYGFRIYGKGHDTEWQSGLPTAGPGTESIDMEGWFDLAGNISPNSSIAGAFEEMITKLGHYSGKDMKQLLVAMKVVTKNTENISEAVVKTLNIIQKFKELSKNLPADKAVCPTCNNSQDSSHVDQINGAGTFKQLKDAGTSEDGSKKEEQKRE
jgi:RHS repeat-associated protein